MLIMLEISILLALISCSTKIAVLLNTMKLLFRIPLLGIRPKSPTLTRRGEDHGYIRMDKYLHWYEAFRGNSKSKSMRA